MLKPLARLVSAHVRLLPVHAFASSMLAGAVPDHPCTGCCAADEWRLCPHGRRPASVVEARAGKRSREQELVCAFAGLLEDEHRPCRDAGEGAAVWCHFVRVTTVEACLTALQVGVAGDNPAYLYL
jgi:hypothetical protein